MFDKFKGALSGKKTYISAGLGAVTAIAAYLMGDIGGQEALTVLWNAVLAATIRNGIK